MTTNFSTNTTLTNVFEANLNPIDPAKQGLVFASRQLNVNNQLIPPQGGQLNPGLYVPFQLGAYQTPGQALSKLRTMGFQYTQGLSFDETYPAPDSISINPNNGLTTLIWNSSSIGLQNLIGLNPVGSVTQINGELISTATIKSINILANQTFLIVVPVTGSPLFSTSNSITIDALLASNAPDPKTSDMVTLAAYWFYNQYVTAAKFTSSPNLWVSVTVASRDASISPTDTPITLVTPTSVTFPGDGSTNLTYPITAYQLGLLPAVYLGNTTVTQTISLPTDGTEILYYADGVYIRGSSDNDGLGYSLDGSNWVASNITTGSFASIIWNGSVYVAVGANNNGIYHSVNGRSWTVSNINTGTYTQVAFANTKFVAAYTGGLDYSSDGITWTACTGTTGHSFKSLVYGNGISGGVWVAVTINDDAWNSTDGITFTALSISTSGFESADFANGIFQLGGVGTGIVYSTDGTNFLASNLTTLNVYSIIYDTTLSTPLWLAATSVGIYSSTNGITWTITSQTTGSFKGFAVGVSITIAYSTAGIFYSSDDLGWTICTGAGASGNILTALYNNGDFLAGSSAGLLQSINGINWIEGAATVQGTFNGYTLTATTCIINVVNVVGGNYNTTNSIVVVLDSSQNGGALTRKNQISSFATLNNIKDVTTLTGGVNSDFYDLIGVLQAPAMAANNKFNVQGYYGYSPAYINENPLSTLTTPDTTIFKASARLDIPTLYQYPNLPVVHVMETLFQNLNNETPYNDTSGEASILNMQSSTNESTIPSDGDLNQLANQGWTAIGALSTGQMYVYRDLCTLQTIDGIEDTEFRSEPLQLKTRWLDLNLYQVAVATVILPNGMRANNNPELIAAMNSNMKRVLLVGFQAGMLGNTQNSVTVIVNPSQPSRLLISVITTVVPTNSGSDITVYEQSFTV